MKHSTSSSSLGEPGGLECDSAAATTSIVNTDIPATVRKLNDDVLSLELLLHNHWLANPCNQHQRLEQSEPPEDPTVPPLSSE